MPHTNLRRVTGLVLVFVCLTLPMTWPLGRHLASFGRFDSGDGMYSIWVVAWVAHQITHDPLHLFDANIFYPVKNTLAFSESTVVSGIMGMPVYLVTHNATLTHNIVLLLTFVLSGLVAALLVRRLTGRGDAGLLAGIIFAFCPYRFAHTPHIQLEMTQWIPLTLLALDRLAERPSVGRALLLGISYAVASLACGYYGVYLAFALVMAGTYYAATGRGEGRSAAFWRGAVISALLAALLVAPVVWVHAEVRRAHQFSRSAEESAVYAAHLGSYLTSVSRLHQAVLPRVHDYVEPLFPGFTPLALAMTLLVKRRRSAPRPSQAGGTGVAGLGLYLLIGAFFVWFSFGPAAGLYRWLYATLPWFDMMRAPARAGVMIDLVVAVLAGAGFARVREWLPPRQCLAAGAALFVLVVAEFWTAPLRFRAGPPIDVGYETLLRQPPGGAVAVFPFPITSLRLHEHTMYMYESTFHWRPLVNGYSDVIPREFVDLTNHFRPFPSTAAIEALRDVGVRYVLFHMDRISAPNQPRFIEWLRHSDSLLRFCPPGNKVLVYEILPRSEAAAGLVAGRTESAVSCRAQ